jgi:hypothetical protein
MLLPIPNGLAQSDYPTIAKRLVTALLDEHSYFESEPWLLKAVITEYTGDTGVWATTYEEARAWLCRDLQHRAVPRRLALQCICYADSHAKWGTVMCRRVKTVAAVSEV